MKFLGIAVGGDSNGFAAQVRAAGTVDTARGNVYQYRTGGPIELVGNNQIECVDSGILNTTLIGPYVQYCHMLEDAGGLPSGYNWLIIPHMEGGTNFADGPNHWSTLDNPVGVPGPNAVAWKNTINAATTAMLLSDPLSRPHSIVWNSGANDGSNTLANAGMAAYDLQHKSFAAYMRANCPGWGITPWLEIPIPFDWLTNNLGSGHYEGVTAFKQDIHNQEPNAFYVDTHAAPILHSDANPLPANGNSGRHYSAGSARGTTQTPSGIDDTNGWSHQVVTPAQSVAGRMVTAYQSSNRTLTIKWNT